MAHLLYEAEANLSIGIKVLFIVILLILIVPAIFFYDSDPEGTYVMLGTVILVTVILWFILPRKYRIMEDGVQIVLGNPFTVSVPFDTIQEVVVPKGLTTGVNFCTSFTGVVQIKRFKKRNVNITPAVPEQFLENLQKALALSPQKKEKR